MFRGGGGSDPLLVVISHSTKCSEGVADLASDSFFWLLICLVSDSRIFVSASQFLVLILSF